MLLIYNSKLSRKCTSVVKGRRKKRSSTSGPTTTLVVRPLPPLPPLSGRTTSEGTFFAASLTFRHKASHNQK